MFVAESIRDLVAGGELEPVTSERFGLVYVVTDRGAAALTEDWW